MESFHPSIHDRHGRALLERYQKDQRDRNPQTPGPPTDPAIFGLHHTEPFKVGIIGAGVTGLYVAMILKDLGIEYEVLEANSKERVGGRLFTHKFGDKPNDYYDVGAMRFPQIPLMKRTFELFDTLGFDASTVIPYVLTTNADVKLFNGHLVSGPEPAGEDSFNVSVSNGGTVPDIYVQKGYQYWLEAALSEFRKRLVDDFDDGWDYLMKHDKHSMRSYMALDKPAYPTSVINWIETMDSGTGLFDYALTEAVMESLDFDYPQEGGVKWFCIQGGAQKIATAMVEKLGPKPPLRFGKRVKSIFPVIRLRSSQTTRARLSISLGVTVDGEDNRRTYSHIISTIPLSCLRMVDMDRCPLSYALKNALRELHYGGSVKVGIQFTDRWWEDTHKGGVSKTDRPTRVVVYPSYGIGDSSKGTTMLCSYTWGQDASRFAALVQGPNSSGDKILLDLILKDLSEMHPKFSYKELKAKVVDHHAWNWDGNEFSVGAFAHFGATQFATLYPEVTQPAVAGLLHFGGEATSVNHAWVAGALDSAYRCVWEMLVRESRLEKITALKQRWGHVHELREDLLEKQIALGLSHSMPKPEPTE